MYDLDSNDVIIACSTGSNTNNAIAIIRISGFDSLHIFQEFFTIKTSKIKPRYVHYTALMHENRLIDDICLSYFEGPKSYTGENVLELSVHGNALNIERVLKLFIDQLGFRYAQPGEFTLRALKNKKLTLSQVEGLDLFLNASSYHILDQGLSILNGSLEERFKQLYQAYLNHKSAVELSIDFMDDIGEEEGERQLEETRKVLFSIIEQLYNQLHQDIDLTNPEVAIIGQPNAGKSTLFNKILKTERSIVSKTAGTTRDYISEKIRINNTIYSIFDTAGIRATDDSIEEKGIELALDRVKNSFYKILVINPFETSEAYFSKIQNLNFDQIIFTHKDLKGFDKHKKDILQMYISIFGPMGASSLNGPTGADSKIGPIEPVISEFSPEINDLSFVTDRISDKFSKFSKQEILNIDRHKFEISNIYKQYLEYVQLAENTNDISIISSELNIVGNCISRLIGIISPDEVLHNIFSNFCIGK